VVAAGVGSAGLSITSRPPPIGRLEYVTAAATSLSHHRADGASVTARSTRCRTPLTKIGGFTKGSETSPSNDLGDIDIQQANLSIENGTTLEIPRNGLDAAGGTSAL
jgi:hypothetical protein